MVIYTKNSQYLLTAVELYNKKMEKQALLRLQKVAPLNDKPSLVEVGQTVYGVFIEFGPNESLVLHEANEDSVGNWYMTGRTFRTTPIVRITP